MWMAFSSTLFFRGAFSKFGAFLVATTAEPGHVAKLTHNLHSYSCLDLLLICSIPTALAVIKSLLDLNGSIFSHFRCFVPSPRRFCHPIWAIFLACCLFCPLCVEGCLFFPQETGTSMASVRIIPAHNDIHTSNTPCKPALALLLMACILGMHSVPVLKTTIGACHFLLWLLLNFWLLDHSSLAIDGVHDEQALVLASGSVLFRMSLHLTLCGVQQFSLLIGLISGCTLGKAATQLFTRHRALPIYSHLGIDTRIHTAPLSLKRSLLRLSHNIGKGQCFWRSVAHWQHAWKAAKRRALTALLPCSRQAEAKHRGQWASQVEIAAYSQAYSTPVMVLSKQQGKAFVLIRP